jgi:branched-chain amino acid transport system substrate-binding protein
LLVVLFLVGCGGSRTGVVMYVGHVAPLTGPEREVGQSDLRGIQLAVQQANNDEEESGVQINVLHADARPTDVSFAAEALRLAQINQVAALLGGRTAEQVSGLDQAQVPVVAPAGYGGPSIHSWVYLTGITPGRKGKVLAQAALQKLAPPGSPSGVIGLLGASTAGGGAGQAAVGVASAKLLPPGKVFVLVDRRHDENAVAAEAFAKEWAAKAPSAQPAAIARPQTAHYRTDKELDELVPRLQAEQPAAIFLAGAAEAVGHVRRAWKGPAGPILFAGPEGSQKELLANPATADNLFLVTAWVPGADTTANQDFRKRYRAEFKNEEPDVHAALAYDNTRLLIVALRECNKTFTSRTILGKLGEVSNFPGLTGKVSFAGERVLQRPAFIVQLRSGQPVLIQRDGP